MWQKIDNTSRAFAHYSIMKRNVGISGMVALRDMFPDAEANELNFVLFSTSGVHGTYNTIEKAESVINGEDNDGVTEVTFLIVHPRLVALRYGTCAPRNMNDIEFLKTLRESSKEVVQSIG